ncbi:MAG: hypothetical protein ACRDUY_12405 [Nitriliruptorales bacterium]
MLAVTGVLLLLAGATLLIRGYQPLVATDLLAGGTELETFGASGSVVFRYEHGAETFYAVTLRNEGRLAVTVTGLGQDIELPLLDPVELRYFPQAHVATTDPVAASSPFTAFAIPPSEERTVLVRARFDNCEYYTERALEVVETLRVAFRVLGIPSDARVALPRQLIVRSPTILRCPDRTADRGENRRTDP